MLMPLFRGVSEEAAWDGALVLADAIDCLRVVRQFITTPMKKPRK